jgi:hypothetical protein
MVRKSTPPSACRHHLVHFEALLAQPYPPDL